MDTEKVVISGFAGPKPVPQPKVNVCMRTRPRKENFILSHFDLERYIVLRRGLDPVPELNPDRLIRRHDREFQIRINERYGKK